MWDIPFSTFNPDFMKVRRLLCCHNHSSTSRTTLTNICQFGVISGVFYGFSTMLTKLSVLTLFLRFVPEGKLRFTIHIIMVTVVLYILVAAFDWVYTCQPIAKYWDLTITDGSCINWVKLAVFSSVMNVVTDVALLVLPIIFLRNLRLPTKQKVGVMIVLMTGGLYV